MNPRCIIVDGSFLAYSRYCVASVSWGDYFARKVDDLAVAYSPKLIFIAWDHPAGAMHRRQLHPAYKAKRPEKPPDFLDNLKVLQKMKRMRDRPVTHVWSRTGEADDCIASIVREGLGPHMIFSADKDMLQLVNESTSVLKAGVNGRADLLLTFESLPVTPVKFGQIEAELDGKGWLDLLTLAGDPGDGVPGIAGIGPKRALELLQACPRIVDLVLSDTPEGEEEVTKAVRARNVSLAKWAYRTMARREELRVSRELIALRDVELEMW